MRTAFFSLLLCSICLAADGFEIKPIDDKSLGVWEEGKPVLVYQSEEEAAQVMVGTEARALRFAELEDWWRGLAREHP